MYKVEYVVVCHGTYGPFSVVRKETHTITKSRHKTRAEAETEAEALQKRYEQL